MFKSKLVTNGANAFFISDLKTKTANIKEKNCMHIRLFL